VKSNSFIKYDYTFVFVSFLHNLCLVLFLYEQFFPLYFLSWVIYMYSMFTSSYFIYVAALQLTMQCNVFVITCVYVGQGRFRMEQNTISVGFF
jgi:hypothetical protein